MTVSNIRARRNMDKSAVIDDIFVGLKLKCDIGTATPVTIVVWTATTVQRIVLRGLAGQSHVVLVQSCSAAARALQESTLATVLVVDTVCGEEAEQLELCRRFPMLQTVVVDEGSGRKAANVAKFTSSLDALSAACHTDQLDAVLAIAMARARAQSPTGLAMGAMVRRPCPPSVIARRYVQCCLIANQQSQRPGLIAAELGISLRTIERRLTDDKLPGPRRLFACARLLRAVWMLQSECHTLGSVATALGISDPSILSRLIRSAGLSARAARERSALQVALTPFCEVEE